MALKQINSQYTNTDNIVKTYSVDNRYFVAFKGGIEIELKGDTASSEYAKLSAYFDKTRTGEFVNKDIIYKTYQVGSKYYLEFTNGQKIEIAQAEYTNIISDSGESPIDPQSLNASIQATYGLSGDVTSGGDKYRIGLDMTHATATGMVLGTVAGTTAGSIVADWTTVSSLPETTDAGKVLKSTSTAGTVEWGTVASVEYKNASGVSQGQMKFVKCTQDEYDDIETPDSSTLYVIVG